MASTRLFVALAVWATVTGAVAAEFECTVLDGTYEPHGGGRTPSLARAREQGARYHDEGVFTVQINADSLRFVSGTGDDAGRSRSPPYLLREVPNAPGVLRAFSRGELDEVDGWVRMIRANIWGSSYPGRFVLHVFDYRTRLPQNPVVVRERFKADCGDGDVPVPHSEYIRRLKRDGLWRAGNAGAWPGAASAPKSR